MEPLPERHQFIARYVVERFAGLQPDREALLFEDGEVWTYRHLRDEAYRAANVLADAGARRGEPTLVFLPNDASFLRAYLGLQFLGAVPVPINTAYRGALLEHVCRDSTAGLIVTDEHLGARLDAVELPLEAVRPRDLTSGDSAAPSLDRPLEAWDVAQILYTSGTTGPSKGVVMPYLHNFMAAKQFHLRARPDDTYLIDIPLFHVGALAPLIAHLTLGARLAVRTVFSASRYLDVMREVGANGCLLVGSMAPALLDNRERPDDADTPWRHAYVSPMIPDPKAFARRFGLEEVWIAFGGTEMGCVFYTEGDIPDPRTVGKVRPGMEVRIVDEHDVPLPPGQVGELVMRTDRPWELAVGYWNNPQKTAEVWRNGWFHSGDAFTCDDEGNYYFVDRLTDSLRRRGENISSFEVEREVMTHPDVAEAACVAAPGRFENDDEVKVFVVPARGATVDPAELVQYLVTRLPYFMVPRFVDVVDDLPRTPTAKVKKHELRERGNSETTWDREAAGIVVNRHS